MFKRIVSKSFDLLPDPSPVRAVSRATPLTFEENYDEPPIEENIEDQALPRNDLLLRLGEHVGIVGSTGSGKTYFAVKGLLSYYREHFPHAKRYLLDSTDDPGILRMVPDSLQVYGNEAPDLLRDNRSTLIWTPRNSKIPASYAKWFARLNDAREPEIVIIDEAASITKEAEDELEALLKQLRKHGGTVVTLTQQISRMNTTLFSQMTHYVQFSMGAERYDLSQARQYLAIAKEEQREPHHQYGFFYRRTRGNFPMREFHDMRDFFNQSLI